MLEAPEEFYQFLTRVQAGDRESLNRLFRHYQVVLVRKLRTEEIRRFLLSKVDPQDVVQETLLKAHQSLPDFQGSTWQELEAWLNRIVDHCWQDQLRYYSRGKRQAHREVSLDDENTRPGLVSRLATPLRAPDQEASHNEECRKFREAFLELPERHRAVIEMRIWDGLSFVEIGRRLGCQEDAARMHFQRALRRLHRLLRTPARVGATLPA